MSSKTLFAAVALTAAAVSAQSAPVELANNGGFETGDFTGWTLFPSAPGNIAIATPGQMSAFAGCVDNMVAPSASLIKNANIGVGTVMPGESITITFDAKGSTANGGVVFAEFFSEVAGGGVSRSEILGGAPLALDPNPNTWTAFSFTTTTGPDVSGGVTLQLAGITGAVGGSVAQVCFDNASVTVMRPTVTASYTPFGTGCAGNAGTPTLAAPSLPWFGSNFQVQLQNLPNNALAWLAIGFSNTQWAGGSLPFDLGAFGVNGCRLYASGDLVIGTMATGSTATFDIPLMLPSLIGTTFFNQGLALDPGVNPAGIVVSDAAQGLIGLQ